jgi:hypothetical protein
MMRFRFLIVTRLGSGLVLAGILACASAPVVRVPDTEAAARMRADMGYLAGPRLRGRLTGTPGNDSAAAFIARRYAYLGLQPVFPDRSCDGGPSCGKIFLEAFRVPPRELERVRAPVSDRTQNVGAVVIGTDSVLQNEYVIVGAHYDHLGTSQAFALDSSAFTLVHLGADDNASGTVAVLELARRLGAAPARRSVMFVNFSAEELGLIGSGTFVANMPVGVSDVAVMVNLDMVGRLRGDRLTLYTAGAERRFRQIVDSVKSIPPAIAFKLSWHGAEGEASDQLSFAEVHIPVFSPFTGLHSDYHRAGDVPSRINFAGMEKVVDLTERVIRAVADGERLQNAQ